MGVALSERLGILSDTHGDAARARRAIALLQARGASCIIHLGDVGGEEVLDLFAGIEALVLFGNTDDARGLRRYAEALDIPVVHPAAIIETKSTSRGRAGRPIRIGMTHGHLPDEIDRLFRSDLDILLHGHTHVARDEIIHGVRVMNPGALHRAERHTAMLLDLETGSAEWLDVDHA